MFRVVIEMTFLLTAVATVKSVGAGQVTLGVSAAVTLHPHSVFTQWHLHLHHLLALKFPIPTIVLFNIHVISN